MPVIFNSAQDSSPYHRDASPKPAGPSHMRGLLDFGALMKGRGLLDAQPFTGSGGASIATRFDEGSLFGQAVLARHEPLASRTPRGNGTELQDLAPDEEAGGNPELAPSTPGADTSNGANEPAVAREGATNRLANIAPGAVFGSASAMRALATVLRAVPGAKISGSAAAGKGGLAARFRYIEELGPVHVIVQNGCGRLQLTVRIASISGEQADLLERRLRKTAIEEGTSVSDIRLNGTDRPDEMGKSRHG